MASRTAIVNQRLQVGGALCGAASYSGSVEALAAIRAVPCATPPKAALRNQIDKGKHRACKIVEQLVELETVN